MRKCGIEIQSLSAHRVVDKLTGSGIEVLGAEKKEKNTITVWVNGKDRKKVFAILQGSCYNVVGTSFHGLEKVKQTCLKSVGLLAGAAVFLASVCFMQSRVLKIEVVGSGAYYAQEVNEILSRNGSGFFAPAPEEGAVTAEILALPRVSFCSVKLIGGVLTVTVEVSDENAVLEGAPLLSPADGKVEELVVVRGTALVSVGDSVQKGDVLVDNRAPVGESGSRPLIVIARVKVSFAVAKEYALGEEEALAQALLDYGEIKDVKTTQTKQGVLVEGIAALEAAINLD